MSVEDALLVAGWIAAVVGFSWTTVVVHEYGHLLVGLLVGLPRDSARVVIGARPPHVELRTSEGWVSPDHPRYVEAFTCHRDSVVAGWLFTGGGFLVETVVVLGGGALLVFANLPAVAVTWLAVSALLVVLYVATDIARGCRVDVPTGDCSALWKLSAPATILFIGSLFAVRIVALIAFPGV